MCFTVKNLILSSEETFDSEMTKNHNDCCTDVIVEIEEEEYDGKKKHLKYVASFFTFEHLTSLNATHILSGDYLSGTYFFSRNMLLINNCSPNNILNVVNHLIDEGNFREVFREI